MFPTYKSYVITNNPESTLFEVFSLQVGTYLWILDESQLRTISNEFILPNINYVPTARHTYLRFIITYRDLDSSLRHQFAVI